MTAKSARARLALSFHRTFSLNRSALAQVLKLAGEFQSQESKTGRALSWDIIRNSTDLGTIQVESSRRYAFRCGLLDDHEHPTLFGQAAGIHDPSLDSLASQWGMHYHLSTPFGSGVGFWHYLVTRFLQPGDETTRDEVGAAVTRFVEGEGAARPKDRTAADAASAFLRSYSDSAGLQRLHLIGSSSNGSYPILEPAIVPLWAFAYALADYWQHQWGDQVTVNPSSLFEDGGLARIFFLSPNAVDDLVDRLQQAGVVDVYRAAPPYQLVRRWDSDAKISFLEHAYGSADA